MHKAFYQQFLLVFSVYIYSEDRLYPEESGYLYKHFITIKFLGFQIFHTFWRTGMSPDTHEVNSGGFFYNRDYHNDHPVPSRKVWDWVEKYKDWRMKW